MSDKRPHAKVNIGGKNIPIPVYQDIKETQRIADLVTERMKEIETDAERIDTQAFALQTAFEFATEMLATREELEHDIRELIKALDGILTHLQELNESIESGE